MNLAWCDHEAENFKEYRIESGPMNIQDAAIQILKDAGKPLHANEIAKLIIDSGALEI
ncbi:MAG: winged helix-turn-helix domain-containing protein [Kiritimatiellae bacterium]|nr:winged helix-turn-helix domain-containing protein [Kiritimatiellia bacterium]